VRSSASMEDSAQTSFAGQQDTYLWILGEDAVLEHVQRWEAAKDPWFNFSSGNGMYSTDRVWLDHLEIPLGFIRDYVGRLQAGEEIERPTEQIRAERERITAEYRELLPDDEARAVFDEKLGLSRLVFPYVEDHNFRVVGGAEDLDQIQQGEVLVTRITAPSWGPVFGRIAATVTDIGGMMSHAAIVCREYGLPAVTGVGSATTAIQTGQRVRVDGNNGTVTILD